jgi:TolB-like protein
LADLLETLRPALADRYDVQRELGRGGMATVFYAEDLKHRRGVAIKVLHPDIAEAIGLDRFQREIDIAAKLQHPHILPLYDSGSAAGYLYYVMPFVEGESLRDMLDREKQLSQEDVIRITGQVASALGYAHSHGVVHRDIKPENILLSGGTAVVADFGIARAEGGDGSKGTALTQAGTVIGTPAYMSPEQSMGRPDIDGRSDQYSLACVVYEMLVGEPPFTGATAQAIMARHSIDHVSPPSIVREAIPETMEAAVLRGLAKTPADRFPTVIMFAEALGTPSSVTAAMRRRSTSAQPVTPRRMDWRIMVTAGALVVLGGGWFAFGRKLHREAAPGPDPRSVAVRYFEDRSPGHELAYVADGLTETLIHELSTVPQLSVISANGVRPYRNRDVSSDSLRKALRVGTIVEGTVVQGADSVQVDVSLTNTATGDEQGHTRLRYARRDLLALQDTLARAVAFFLRREIGEEVQLQASRAGTDNEAAWELVQRARDLTRGVDSLLAARDSAGANRHLLEADSLLGRAASLDGNWVEPVIQRGWVAFATRRVAGLDRTAAAEWIGRGLGYAEQALRQEPTDPEALDLRGTLRFFRYVLNLDPAPLTPNQLLAAAEADLRAGTAPENPNRARAWFYLAALYLRTSKTAEAKVASQSAIEADPYLTEAESLLWRLDGFARFPKDPVFTECQITQYALRDQKPDIAKAWKLLKQNVSLYPPTDTAYRRRRGEFLVAMAIARAAVTNPALKDSARHVAVRARTDDARIDPTHEFAYIEMLLRNLLGDTDEALHQLTLFLATNPQERANVAKDSTWWLEGLRGDPRFKSMVGAR